jgi:cytochrome c-type biogenesis protein CcsB
MAVLLILFGTSIAVATFVENTHGTDAARYLIYNSKWFEILLILGCINILAVTLHAKLFRKKKLTVLLFHLSFLLIIVGAGITRYTGMEGSMPIREGETTDKWYSSGTNLGLYCRKNDTLMAKYFPVLFSPVGKNRFKRSVNFDGHKIDIRIEEYLPNAKKVLQFDPEGAPVIHLVTSSAAGREELFLNPGQILQISGAYMVFTDSVKKVQDRTIQLFLQDGNICFLAPFDVSRLSMTDRQEEIMTAGTVHSFVPLMLHYFNGVPIVLKEFMASGTIDATPVEREDADAGLSALKMNVTADNSTQSLLVFGRKDMEGRFSVAHFKGFEIGVSYGTIQRKLPFKIRLNDFILKRYPGSESPSWYESNVQLIDPKQSVNIEERVFMNHILKHRGYRFYQSSYDTDEKGTVFSVNHDMPGTTITYLGYLLMALGMLLSLLNRNSRFRKLLDPEGKASAVGKTFMIMILLGSMNHVSASAMGDSLPVIPADHADKFGQILVQDNGGRIKPVNTLASELLRKVARKEEYRGQSADQVLVGMVVYPEQWQHESMIRVIHPEIRKILGIQDKNASFVDFFKADKYGEYILRSYVEQAYRKKPAQRTKFDNEIIRVDERLNIVNLVYMGALFRFFPDPEDTTHTWYSPLTAGTVFTKKDSVFSTHILAYYAEEVQRSMTNGDWKNPDEIVKAIRIFQTNYGKEVMQSPPLTHAEIFYNKANIFERLTHIYLLLGFILLIVQFVQIFDQKLSIRWFFRIVLVLIIVFFTSHTLALILRWYVAGHAPWSNGYEALTFIAWAVVLAGLIFSRKTGIAVSVSAILAALILMTAHLTWMDPQVTNLVPVLQSYWLVIHVAVITLSYAFLGLGAIIAVINLLLLFFQNRKNYERLDQHINLISSVIEMTLIVGLYLLTIGTFLGGIWANESWGRYWGWDPKETWALVTVIVYAIILHLRLLPGMKGRVIFNIVAVAGFASVIMTYFGVNYYLSGMHSYAKGDQMPVPPIIYYSVATFIVLSVLSAFNQYKLKKTFAA